MRAHLEADCKEASGSDQRKSILDKIKTEDYKTVSSYGMTFYKKMCLVKASRPLQTPTLCFVAVFFSSCPPFPTPEKSD